MSCGLLRSRLLGKGSEESSSGRKLCRRCCRVPVLAGDSVSWRGCRWGPGGRGGQGQGAEGGGRGEARGSAAGGWSCPQAGFQGPERTESSRPGLNSQHKLPSARARRHTPLSKTGKAPSVGPSHQPAAQSPQPAGRGSPFLEERPAPRIQERGLGAPGLCWLAVTGGRGNP